MKKASTYFLTASFMIFIVFSCADSKENDDNGDEKTLVNPEEIEKRGEFFSYAWGL